MRIPKSSVVRDENGNAVNAAGRDADWDSAALTTAGTYTFPPGAARMGTTDSTDRVLEAYRSMPSRLPALS
ncbi:hypothetical protein [Streptomyces variabilis]